MKKALYILPILSLLFLSSCATNQETILPDNASAEELYNQAHSYLEQTAYQKAAETFDKVEVEHPYSKWATKAKLMSAYSYYKDEKYDDAINDYGSD
jgi:outer membrane protein assembly factor BamD